MASVTPTKPIAALLTVSEVAATLRVCTETVRRRIQDGTLRSVKFGRVNRIPVDELRRAIDTVFRELPVVALPGVRRVYVRADDVRRYLDEHTFSDDQIRPTTV